MLSEDSDSVGYPSVDDEHTGVGDWRRKHGQGNWYGVGQERRTRVRRVRSTGRGFG